MRKGISMVALVITIIVLIVLTSAVVITGIGAPKQAQLAVFYSNLDIVQELVSLKMGDNMITGALNGYGENYKWVDIVENYTETKGQANEPIYFDKYEINGVSLERISPILLQTKTSLAEGERSKYYVSSNGTVYYDGFVYDGQTYYTKNTEPVANGQTLTNLLPTNGSFYEVKGVNSPRLLPGMTAVYWDTNGNEVTSTNPEADAEFYNNWYDYIAQTGTTENGGTSKWANAKTSDGSYWVWIPRYAYSITSGYHGEGLNYTGEKSTTYTTVEAGEIDVEFLMGKTNKGAITGRTSWDNASGAGNWNIHPAFIVEGIDLYGIWVAKYRMSMETDGISTTTSNSSTGNKTTNTEIKAVSKPGVSPWRYITVGNSFTNGYNYNRALESHLMKNMEWGAIAYLTHSAYGRNKTEITQNTDSSYCTGGGSGTAYKDNGLQSTTGNVYGIYDLSGGSQEKLAAYITTDVVSSVRDQYIGELLTADTKYKEVYDAGTMNDFGRIGGVINYGDAVYEISAVCNMVGNGNGNGSYEASWFGNASHFVCSANPFFKRGGDDSGNLSAGIFAFNRTGGAAYAHSFRVVLWGSLN